MSAEAQNASARVVRCSPRKHVVEDGQPYCDCGAVLLGPTAGRNALVVNTLGVAVPVMVREQADRLPSSPSQGTGDG